jgi:hypothetical protein
MCSLDAYYFPSGENINKRARREIARELCASASESVSISSQD